MQRYECVYLLIGGAMIAQKAVDRADGHLSLVAPEETSCRFAPYSSTAGDGQERTFSLIASSPQAAFEAAYNTVQSGARGGLRTKILSLTSRGGVSVDISEAYEELERERSSNGDLWFLDALQSAQNQ